jgi:hypothetical protein
MSPALTRFATSCARVELSRARRSGDFHPRLVVLYYKPNGRRPVNQSPSRESELKLLSIQKQNNEGAAIRTLLR